MRTLIQHASGKEATALLDMIAPLHRKRCKQFGWRYVCSKVAHPGDRSGAWTRFALAEENIISDPGGFTAVLDGVDVVWWRAEQLAEVFGECGGDWDVGVVFGRLDQDLANSGAIYLKNNERSLDLVRRCLARGEKYKIAAKPYPFGNDLVPVDETLTDELRHTASSAEGVNLPSVKFARLPIWWNDWPTAGGVYPDDKNRLSVVRALHGCNLDRKKRGIKALVKSAPEVGDA